MFEVQVRSHSAECIRRKSAIFEKGSRPIEAAKAVLGVILTESHPGKGKSIHIGQTRMIPRWIEQVAAV